MHKPELAYTRLFYQASLVFGGAIRKKEKSRVQRPGEIKTSIR